MSPDTYHTNPGKYRTSQECIQILPKDKRLLREGTAMGKIKTSENCNSTISKFRYNFTFSVPNHVGKTRSIFVNSTL